MSGYPRYRIRLEPYYRRGSMMLTARWMVEPFIDYKHSRSASWKQLERCNPTETKEHAESVARKAIARYRKLQATIADPPFTTEVIEVET